MWFTGSTVAIFSGTNRYRVFRIVTANLNECAITKLRIYRVLTNNETQFSNFDHFSCFQALKIPPFLYCHFSCVYSRIFVCAYWNRSTIIRVESFTLTTIIVPRVIKNATFCPSISRFFDFSFFLSKTSLSTIATIRLHPLDHGVNNIGGWRSGHAASKHAG